jgi:hypothetical protein
MPDGQALRGVDTMRRQRISIDRRSVIALTALLALLGTVSATAAAEEMSSASFRLRGGTLSAGGASALVSTDPNGIIGSVGATLGEPGPTGVSVGENGTVLVTLGAGFWHAVAGALVCALADDLDGDQVCTSAGDNCPFEPNPGQDPKACLCGDVNGDGAINFIDARLILLGQVPPEAQSQRKADVNGDGQNNFIDGRLILLGQTPVAQCPAATTPP